MVIRSHTTDPLFKLLIYFQQSSLEVIVSYVFLQDCISRQEIQGSLKQVQKLLSAHEASYLQSLRNLKKKINLMQSNTPKQPANSKEKRSLSSYLIKVFRLLHDFLNHSFTGTCPKLEAPANGRKLGKSQSVGHEVHFLCDPGYELVGSESRVCQESLTWSGQLTSCRGERPFLVFSCKGHFALASNKEANRRPLCLTGIHWS